MLLEDARSLKAGALADIAAQIEQPQSIRMLGIRSQALGSESEALRSIAVGIAQQKRQHIVAVRVQRRMLLDHPIVERIRKTAKGEVDVRYVGRISKLETPATLQRKRRPLVIGCSVGHFKITAGTLGCIVKTRKAGVNHILSNNHVLANENSAKKGDAILQPGKIDGGRKPDDVVGKLTEFVKLEVSSTNYVDCAIAEPSSDVKYNLRRLGRFGSLKGLGSDFLDEGTSVRKVGRTTGETEGHVTAFELDNVVVQYDLGNLRFDNQVEIEGSGTTPFSDGGDSGSLIFDAENLGVALLFAGGDSGGMNDEGLTYANPLHSVLDALNVDLVY